MSSAAPSTALILDVHYEDFDTQVIAASATQPILVDLGRLVRPCHALAPHLKRVIEEQNGRLRLAKVEVDEGENMRLAGQYRVRGFPTVILFQQGEERGRFSGARSRTQINHWLQEHVSA